MRPRFPLLCPVTGLSPSLRTDSAGIRVVAVVVWGVSSGCLCWGMIVVGVYSWPSQERVPCLTTDQICPVSC